MKDFTKEDFWFIVAVRSEDETEIRTGKAPAEQVLKDIRRQTRRQYSAEEKIRIVLEGLRGEENISELCRREGIAASMYYGWSKEFLEAGKPPAGRRHGAGRNTRRGEGSSSREPPP